MLGHLAFQIDDSIANPAQQEIECLKSRLSILYNG